MSKKVLVIGNGSIGVAVASRLNLLGYSPVFMGRTGPVNVHVHFSGWGQNYWLETKKLSQSDLSKISCCFIAVKAFDLEGALKRFITYIPQRVPIITLSNGSTQGILESLQKIYPNHRLRLGFCTAGVTMIKPNHYELRSQTGGVYWGKLKEQDTITIFERKLSNESKDNFFNYLDSIFNAHRIKWLYNTVINSICAVKGYSKNEMLLIDTDYLKKVFDETFDLGEELWEPWQQGRDNLFSDMISLITATAKNENSMYRDIKLKQRTETNYLAGLAPNKEKYKRLVQLHKQIVKLTPVITR